MKKQDESLKRPQNRNGRIALFRPFLKKIKNIVDNWVSDHGAFLRSRTYSAFRGAIPTRHNTRYVPFVMGVGAG